ncbi:uncharacterized protein BO88DRAFT_409410 [Aspergillus vadensis CBS 113365]|uniref:Uncharacterized protein n=1 Tax=Aspergillus vadensis (strain CBS 113365 / IMI 142717 / IBT 24658) TaxID=1448311 RepID=A0A319BIP3_ASPVC|nr:hypothetical protein BO88DRAFT_409410 [Aspergillus vadensis CBS 113365]PYH63208.1 hypothetical protein BO88DRAFT_409410 [Aspergillus vadensis CBS 113365]
MALTIYLLYLFTYLFATNTSRLFAEQIPGIHIRLAQQQHQPWALLLALGSFFSSICGLFAPSAPQFDG